jgi:hypothetical protein
MTYVTATTTAVHSTATTKVSFAATATIDSSVTATTKVSFAAAATTTKDNSIAAQEDNFTSWEENITKEDNFIII